MMLVYELLYRSTVQLHGFRILQVAPGHMQYRMLDELQLGAEAIVHALVENVLTADRTYAVRVLDDVRILRNAFSHGAIEELDQHTTHALRGLIMKGVQCLVDAGIHKMTAGSAYHLWISKCRRQHGFDTKNWLEAEDTVLADLERFAKL